MPKPRQIGLFLMVLQLQVFAGQPDKHWAYLRPERPALPDVQNTTWPTSPIDHFVLAKLEEHGLQPSGPTDPANWLRRASLDLTGLPPTLEELDTFLVDKSPDAKEKATDRLLASPHYGERWAQPWLDLARYGDSTGIHEDEIRPSWAWRDWVIGALNQDMPFDQFTIEQLAGDLLENPTLQQRVATGFHRASPCNLEGGTPKEARRSAQVLDRVIVTRTVWLGTTFECAQCHDHKYDPLSQADFFSFYSLFNNTPDETGGNVGPGRSAMAGPILKVGPTTTFVMNEMAKPRPTRIFERGDYEKPGKAVPAKLPETLFKASEDLPKNRLGLAKWLVDPDNPLTPRVTVNRWWAELFGTGLVRTPEDFGKQGELPTHTQLLDWLAVEFVENGWSMKHILKTIVLSSTYGQTSKTTPAQLETDPNNTWLSRAPRLRLPAESLRDNALAISSLLSPAIGGRPTYPPQPPDIWWIRDGKSPKYEESHGEARYRRGLYTIWRRLYLHPSLATFDAPDRVTCTVQRIRTNTPLQALTLLNDPIYLEAAFGLARKLYRMHSQSQEKRIAHAFRQATSRKPTTQETQLLQDLFSSRKARFLEDPEACQELIQSVRGDLEPGVPPLDTEGLAQLAALFHVANVLLNLDETITKG